ncbi:EAL domain-containing protein [Terrisporobacter glycolicus]|uniref:EAL domain-containing protein n=1 Tax=Terrisporobacter glycolicus ATCC 14880 = DSM 1288 TaxID=1121315 RepID=A0ABZ2ET89_9FIRM|nr:EAL domain-containing protein [Terrisporobacter glycolicus]
MKKSYKSIILIGIIFIILCIYLYIRYSDLNHVNDSRIIKVGVYEYEPCYYIGKNQKVKGYYDDVIKIINRYDEYTYEYEISSFKNTMEKLECGKVDIVVGLNKTDDRMDKIVYSDKSIGVQRYGIFSNNSEVMYVNLENMENLKLGVIKNENNGEYIKDLFKNKNIDVNTIEFYEQGDMINSFKRRDLDLSIQPINKQNYGKLVYEFSTGPVYIGASKKNKDIIIHINEIVENNKEDILKDLEKSYNKYFKIKENSKIFRHIISTMLIISIIFVLSNFRKIKSISIKIKIKYRIKNDKYILYYQSIFDPNVEKIVGFEALIRQKCKNGRVLSPNSFLDEVESNNMLHKLSLWVLENVMKDYKKIHEKYRLESGKYISVNISVNELINDDFIKKSIELMEKYNLSRNSICFEIIERVKSESISKLSTCIEKLKDVGYLIAIDDFGMEHSNLDLLGKIEFDIIKLDRYFIYTISKKYLKEEIIKFLSAVSKRADSVLVVEGVETEEQINLIKSIDNDKIYVQGYYYSKPSPI